MIYRIEISDASFNTLEYLEKEAMDINWNYNRIGGCGSFSFSLPREFCNEKFISGDFNIKIYKKNTVTKAYDLWYQGFVENKIPTISNKSEIIQINGNGYANQLSRIYIDQDYTNTEISEIVKDILDTYVVPETDITYDLSDIEDTGFTADSLSFNSNAKRVLETCADIAGTREWGVDRNRKFFFKARSETVGFRKLLGKNVVNYSEDFDFKDIVNRIIFQGGKILGEPYIKIYNFPVSQLKYGVRAEVVQKASVTTDSVSEQYANALYAERGDVLRKTSCEVIGEEDLIESVVPIPLFQVIAKGVHYSERKYNEFLYSGLVERQLNRINYRISNNSPTLQVRMELDYLKPSIGESIAKLDYLVEQQRSADL